MTSNFQGLEDASGEVVEELVIGQIPTVIWVSENHVPHCTPQSTGLS